MKTTDLIEQVAAKAGIAKSAAKEAVEAMLAGIIDAAKQGDEMNFTGFGKFKVRNSPARQGRNPGHRRDHRDRRLAQARLRASQAGQGRSRRLTPRPR